MTKRRVERGYYFIKLSIIHTLMVSFARGPYKFCKEGYLKRVSRVWEV